MAKEVTPEQIEMLDGMVAKARAAAEIIATYDQAVSYTHLTLPTTERV